MSEAILIILGGGSGATIYGIVKAIIDQLSTRKNKSADAASVIEESASSAVKRVERDNERLRARVEKVENLLEELRVEVHARGRRIDDLSDEIEDFRLYAIDLRNELQRQDPTLHLPEPPARIARHFQPP